MTFPQLNPASKLNYLIAKIAKSADPAGEFKKSVAFYGYGAVMAAKLRSRLQLEENIIIPKAESEVISNHKNIDTNDLTKTVKNLTWLKEPSRNFIEKRLKKWTLIRDNLDKMDDILADYKNRRAEAREKLKEKNPF